MSIPRRRLTYTSKALVASSSRVEKPKSPALQEIPVWVPEYQRGIEEPRKEYLLLKQQEEPEEAELGEEELALSEDNSNWVQSQWWEHTQQVMHVIQACNEEMYLLAEQFESVWSNIDIVKVWLHTQKQRIEFEVFGVGLQMSLPQAALPEIGTGIYILQSQENQIVEEASSLFQRIKVEFAAMSKRITDNTVQILAITGTN